MISKLVPLIAAVITLFIGGCSSSSDPIQVGDFKNGTYHNEFFGFAITLPEGWTVTDDKSLNQRMNEGKNIIAGEDKNLLSKLDTSLQQYSNLLTVSKYPLVPVKAPNAIIRFVAENEPKPLSMNNDPDEYLVNSKRLLASSNMRYRITHDITHTWLGGIPFSMMAVDTEYRSTTLHQVYYSAIIKEHGLGILVMYVNSEDKPIIDRTLESIRSAR
jgi:hypothetical protein